MHAFTFDNAVDFKVKKNPAYTFYQPRRGS